MNEYNQHRRLAATLGLVALGLALLGIGLWQGGARAYPSATVSGVVVDLAGERVAGAVVRQQATTLHTVSGPDGAFALAGLPEGVTVTVTAWDEGMYPGGGPVVPPAAGFTITLRPHPAGDNPDYAWLTSMPVPTEALGCGHCMVAFPQWEQDAHSQSGVNPRFFSMYNGSDLSGTTVVTPGYQLDFPGTAGNCATCHAPGAAANSPFTANMNDLQGVEQEGVFCDFCHKIGNAYLDPATGLPYPNAPGVISYRLYRPPGGTHMFFGTFDDVLRRVSYLELERKSQFCAPCHQFSFWGTPIYESFREWLESPYPAQGIECQTCHMEYEPSPVPYFVLPEGGGLIRDPGLISVHRQPGAADEALLQNTVTMTLGLIETAGRLLATVAITNTGAGHDVPTDYPGRHLILTVEAMDSQGAPLARLGGPIVPAWGGAQAGLPGTGYAKVLRDVVTGEAPVVSYWKQTLIESDNRLPAFGVDRTDYGFALTTAGGPITVTAELRFRRLFQAELEARGWETADIVMERQQVVYLAGPWWRTYLPLIIQ